MYMYHISHDDCTCFPVPFSCSVTLFQVTPKVALDSEKVQPLIKSLP